MRAVPDGYDRKLILSTVFSPFHITCEAFICHSRMIFIQLIETRQLIIFHDHFQDFSILITLPCRLKLKKYEGGIYKLAS